MKFRSDFVTNSSSSGFVAVSIKSKTLSKIFGECGLSIDVLKKFESSFDNWESGCPWMVTDSVALTMCCLLQNLFDVEKYETTQDTLNQLVEKIKENKEAIDADSIADIETGNAESDSGFPDFSYAHLDVKNGTGEYIEYSDNTLGFEGFYDWLEEHGYDEYDLFKFPPFEEIAKNYPGPGVIRIHIGSQNDINASKD